jgi:diphthine synthase
LGRGPVEDEHLINEAKEKEIALLVYGDSLSATTHTQLILACKKANVPYTIYHNASIMIAIAETGLQLYKFGKTPSMPKWQKSFEPTSFLDYYLENKANGAHTLLLTDIGLELPQALEQLKKAGEDKKCEFEKLIVISNAGTDKQKIFYDTVDNLKDKNIPMPFCLILPGKMHHIEAEAIESFREK